MKTKEGRWWTERGKRGQEAEEVGTQGCCECQALAHAASWLDRCVLAQSRSVRVATSLPPLPPEMKLDQPRRVALPLRNLPSTPSSASPRLLASAALDMARTRSKRGEGSSKRSSRASRRKQKAATPPATAISSEPRTLQNFAMLPHELQVDIVLLACSPTPPSSTPAADETAAYSRQSTPTHYPWKRHPRQRLDHDTILSLMLASKKFNELVVPVMYKSVWLSRPSALASFQSALSARPQLACLVQSLHVGPDSTMPHWYHPLSIEDSWGSSWPARTSITTSLREPEDGKLLPRWCNRHLNLEWDVKSAGHDTPSRAIHQALLVAQRDIDVDLNRYQRSMRGMILSSHEAQVRTCEVQASLDLYLMAMRRWEDEQGIVSSSGNPKNKSVSDYPPLNVTGYSTSTRPATESSGSVAPFTVCRSELLRHLAGPHAITDRFDHPLIFARSGVENLVFSDGITEITGAIGTRARPQKNGRQSSLPALPGSISHCPTQQR